MKLFKALIEDNRALKLVFDNLSKDAILAFDELCCEFASLLSFDEITAFRQELDFDKLTELYAATLKDRFIRHLRDNGKKYCPSIALEAYPAFASLFHEIFVRAVRQEEILPDYKFPGISISAFLNFPYNVHLAMGRIEDQHEKVSREEQIEQFIQDYEDRVSTDRSIDADKEERIHLAPAEKVRVLRNAVSKYNEVGHLDRLDLYGFTNVEIHYDILTFKPKDYAYAKAFFASNREVTVEEVMEVARSCVSISLRNAPDGFDPEYHARRGTDIGYLLRNAAKIAAYLEQQWWAPESLVAARAPTKGAQR